MALNNIIFQKQNGGLARALPGEDHISGLLVLVGSITYPSGMDSDNWAVPLGSIEDLEALGFDKTEGSDDEKICALPCIGVFPYESRRNIVVWV